MTESKLLICPYCGDTQPATERCRVCGGTLDTLSRQATHNAMGPWSIRDDERPFFPGCSYETLVRMIERGEVTKYAIIRGPTTKQFWTVAKHVPGVAHLVGYCHACDARVEPTDHGCPVCGVPFGAYLERNYLGLPDVHALPGETPVHGEVLGRAWRAPRMTPLGISSFADDRDVLAPNGAATATAEPAAAEAAETPVPAPTPGAAPETSWRDVPAVRAMERRLTRQQHTIRGLIGLVMLVAVGGALLNIVTVQRAAKQARPPVEIDEDVAAAGELDTSAGEESAPALDEDAAVPLTPAPAPIGDDPDVAAVDDDAPQTPAPALPSWEELPEHVEAMALVERSRDETRPLVERIADLEQAIERLGALEARLEDEAEREAVRELVNRLRLDLERLELDEFFRSPDGKA